MFSRVYLQLSSRHKSKALDSLRHIFFVVWELFAGGPSWSEAREHRPACRCVPKRHRRNSSDQLVTKTVRATERYIIVGIQKQSVV